MYYQALTVPGTSTGNPQVDAWLQQLQPQLDQLRKAGKLDATSMLLSFENAKKYEDLTKEEKMTEMELFLKDPEKHRQFKENGREPRESKLLTDEEFKQKVSLADAEAEARANHRKPDKPEKPDKKKLKQTWMYSPDGTMRFPAVFDSETGATTPQKKGGKWTKVPTQNGGDIAGMMNGVGVANDISQQPQPKSDLKETPGNNLLSESDARRQLESKGVKGAEQDKWIETYKKEGKVK